MIKYLVINDGIELTIGDKSYVVDGEERTAISAPFLNQHTNRTLVPVRLIADAIDAEVSYDNATKTVKIAKDGKVTELEVGSEIIVQDGKVNETTKLDQPVILDNNSSFIPLRAVAELFGKGVFNDKKDILILR